MSIRVDVPLAGFRDWAVGEGGELLSLNRLWGRPARWPVGEPLRGICAHHDRVPSRECVCGLHAHYSLSSCGGGVVSGAVVAGGRIVECATGFRAEMARPVALLEPYGEHRNTSAVSHRAAAVARAAERYDVPVLPDSELVAYAAWFGELGPVAVPVSGHVSGYPITDEGN